GPTAIAAAWRAGAPAATPQRRPDCARVPCVALRRPSIEPYFGDRLILLCQLRAQLDRLLTLGGELEADAHAAGLGIGLQHEILNFAFVRADIGLERPRVRPLEHVASELEHDAPRIVRRRADARLDEARKALRVRMIEAPMQAIGVVVFALGLERVLRPP